MAADLKMKAGSACKVQRRGPAGITWVEGTIKETSGRGAFVRTKEGNSSFYRWTEISFPDNPTIKATAPQMPKHLVTKAPLATLGDKLPALSVVRDSLQQPLPLKPPVAPMSFGPAPAPVVEPQRKPAKSKTARMHTLTQIGSLLRAARMQHAWSQDQVAQKLGISNQRVSKIELGWPPSSDELDRFSILFNIELEVLLDAATAPGGLYEKKEPLPVVEAPKPEPVVEAPAGLVDIGAGIEQLRQEVIEHHAASQGPEAFVDFVGALDDFVAMPGDKALRKEWLEAARVLFKLKHS